MASAVKAIPYKFIIGFVVVFLLAFYISTGEWPWKRTTAI